MDRRGSGGGYNSQQALVNMALGDQGGLHLVQALATFLRHFQMTLWSMSTVLKTACTLLAAMDCKARDHLVRPTWCLNYTTRNRNLSMVTFYKAIPATTGAFLLPIHTATYFLEYRGSTSLARLVALDLALDS
jgi:hypothetical protein